MNLKKGFIMIAFLSILGVACFAVAAMTLSTASTIGAFEVVIAAIFGFGAFVCAFVVGALAIAKHTANKVVNKVRNIKGFIKR